MRRRTRLNSLLCVWTATAVVLGSCRPPPSPTTTHAAPTTTPAIATTTPPSADRGARATVPLKPTYPYGEIDVQLPEATVASAGSTITTLSANDANALLGRLEPLPDLSANAPPPSVRPPSLPPVAPGTIQPIAFVSPSGRSVGDAPVMPKTSPRPLPPPQISPTGNVAAETTIRVRFSEPMVPVAAVGTEVVPPVALDPPAFGKWRWLDTRVLVFEPTGSRLPQATDFAVSVPAGIRAESGSTLAVDARATFTTPPNHIVGIFPNSPARPDAAILVELDQDADPDAIAALLRVERFAGDKLAGKPLAFHVIDLAEARQRWARNPNQLATPDLGAHHVIIAPTTEWPASAHLQVTLAAGAPSREGPHVSATPSFGRFDVVAPFTILGVRCGDDDYSHPRMSGAHCPATRYMSVGLSNVIDKKSYRSDKVQFEGEPFTDNTADGDYVSMITPDTVGRLYGIAIADGMTDIYGQALVRPVRPTFVTSPETYDAYLEAPTGLVVLDPRFAIPQWIVTANAVTSLRVQLYKVAPADYFAFAEYEGGTRKTLPGKRVLDQTYKIGPKDGANLRVDLRPALDAGGLGHVIAIATVDTPRRVRSGDDSDDDGFSSKRVAWIQVTKLGLTARVDGDRVNAWLQDLAPASFLAPIPGVTTTIVVDDKQDKSTTPAESTAVSDATGHAGFELLPVRPPPAHPTQPYAYPQQPPAILLASSATDSTFTAITGYERAIREQQARWYVTDDRFIYKPGEPVYVKGWVRWSTTGVNPDIALPASGDVVSYSLSDSRGNQLASGTTTLTDQGGFDVQVDLPPNANLGTASFRLATRTSSHRHPISIQEFRTPSYAVALNDDVTHAGTVPLIAGESLEMNAEAHYYAGGGLPGAKIEWNARLEAASYRPPGWDRYEFSPETWRQRVDYIAREASQDTTTALSGASASAIVFAIPAVPLNRPSLLTVDSTVTDVDRATIRASSRAILVHPSTYYVGVRQRPLVDDALDVIVTDIAGVPVTGASVEVTIEGVLGSERGRSDAKVIDTQTCKLTSDARPGSCTFTRKDLNWAYTATAHVRDPRGRDNVASYDIPWWSPDDRADLAIVPDRQLYRPGDVAKLEIHSLVVPAAAVVTFARQGVIAQELVRLETAKTIVELPIEASYLEDIHVQVDRTADRRYKHPGAGSTAPIAEHVAAEIDLHVDLESARLAMTARAIKTLVEPGGEATFEVTVRHDDKPVANAEVALMVVDEGVLALTGGKHEDPLPAFYRMVAAGTTAVSTLPLVLDEGEVLAGDPGFTRYSLATMGVGGGGRGYGTIGTGHYGTVGHGAGAGSTVAARKDFRANAVFSPTLHTDAAGVVRLSVTMPDSLTRFRVVAIATADMRYFGKAEGTIVTQRKINARTVAPRFLEQGDAFSLPVVVQNLDTVSRTIDVAVRAGNLVGSGPSGKRVVVPGGERAEVRFDFATAALGRAVVQTIVVSGDQADASNVELPVYAPATTESFAAYGTVDDATQFEELDVPADIFRDVGGVEVEVSSTQLQSITDAYWYLYAYPHECAEQRSARMLATSALGDILEAFATPGRPTPAQITATRVADVDRLERDQLADGSWGYFTGMRGDPFVTMQVLSALGAGHTRGGVVTRASEFVTKQAAELQARLDKSVATPVAKRFDREELPYVIELEAAALSALAAAGNDVRARAEKLHASALALEVYPIDAKARLLAIVAKVPRDAAMRAKLLADLASATEETASSATVTTSYVEAERLLLVSNTKTSALALDAMIREKPELPLITKLARGVLDARRHGRWSSTQDNLVALVAMRRYFDTYEKTTPSFTGKVWLGKDAYAEQAFVGHTSVRATTRVDWTSLVPGSRNDVALVKDGPGRMYYRVGITYAPKRIDLPALDAGFIVRRTYTAIDAPADVTKLADGRWRVKLGARVRVTVEELNSTKRYGVALVDPLPAGFEAVNEALATSERTTTAAGDWSWDYRNLRDDRSEVFSMSLDEGTHQFSYTVRAATPGTFLAAPAKAEEMYSPETFGRSTGTAVVIE